MIATESGENVSRFRHPKILLFLAVSCIAVSFLVWVRYQAGLPFQMFELIFPHQSTTWDSLLSAFIIRSGVGLVVLGLSLGIMRRSFYKESWWEGFLVTAICAFASEVLFTWGVFYLAIEGCTLGNDVLGGRVAQFTLGTVIPRLDAIPGKPFFHPIHDHGWNVALGMVIACLAASFSFEYKGVLGFLNAVIGAFISFFIVFNTPLALIGACIVHIVYSVIEYVLRNGAARLLNRPEVSEEIGPSDIHYDDEKTGW